jgi:alkaline phosphatase
VEHLVEPLEGMKMTANGVVAMMGGDYSVASIIDTVAQYWGLNITPEDAQEILDTVAEAGSMSYSLARVLSKNYTCIGWTTHGHNGETVPVWVHGGDAPTGVIDNTDLALIAADAMDVDLDRATRRLYVDLDNVTHDYKLDMTDPENPVLKIKGAELPISKDYMVYRGRTIKLPGVTVYAPETEKVYVSRKALWFLRLF